jgi:hypothetical protein
MYLRLNLEKLDLKKESKKIVILKLLISIFLQSQALFHLLKSRV